MWHHRNAGNMKGRRRELATSSITPLAFPTLAKTQCTSRCNIYQQAGTIVSCAEGLSKTAYLPHKGRVKVCVYPTLLRSHLWDYTRKCICSRLKKEVRLSLPGEPSDSVHQQQCKANGVKRRRYKHYGLQILSALMRGKKIMFMLVDLLFSVLTSFYLFR
ncbi:uncharacterized protein LOC132627749 isoform X2 [Lycium barbarum]|uniref:uncharacterized protein LOC132627749 isoform X2 n=1 Tax=Lycium barbarum TaxID=112863 RepID=UPI00293F4264|nr:uncharacterized protein LOC132627749 isoform X2 [Lycium barbarum]